jgi:hypothetical protein
VCVSREKGERLLHTCRFMGLLSCHIAEIHPFDTFQCSHDGTRWDGHPPPYVGSLPSLNNRACLQQSVKQLAHSPQRPRLVSSSFTGSLYRGNLVVPPHCTTQGAG